MSKGTTRVYGRSSEPSDSLSEIALICAGGVAVVVAAVVVVAVLITLQSLFNNEKMNL